MRKYYFLLSIEIIYLKGTLERFRKTNILVKSRQGYVTRRELAMAQQQAQIRFKSENAEQATYEIKDIHMAAVSNLGFMRLNEFHNGFEIPEHEIAEEAADQAELPIEPEKAEPPAIAETLLDPDKPEESI